MFNKQSIKRRPQNKSFSASLMQSSKFLSTDDNDSTSLAPIYEQIKSEVVSSVLNWLSMYMAADQEDKKISEKDSDLKHCCECNIKRRSEGSIHSSVSSPFSPNYDRNKVNFNEFDDSSAHNIDSMRMYNGSDIMPRDSNMTLTEYRACQVWPEWCQYVDRRTGTSQTSTSAANSHVYFDKVNGRLCVYRRGLVEYPSVVPSNVDASCNVAKQNFKSLPEVKVSLLKECMQGKLHESFANDVFIDPQKHFSDLNFNKNYPYSGNNITEDNDEVQQMASTVVDQ